VLGAWTSERERTGAIKLLKIQIDNITLFNRVWRNIEFIAGNQRRLARRCKKCPDWLHGDCHGATFTADAASYSA
jgi:hypothetical protein